VSHDISIIDLAEHKVTKSIAVGRYPWGVAIKVPSISEVTHNSRPSALKLRALGRGSTSVLAFIA
jgi:YVTN family beta-propeller protein